MRTTGRPQHWSANIARQSRLAPVDDGYSRGHAKSLESAGPRRCASPARRRARIDGCGTGRAPAGRRGLHQRADGPQADPAGLRPAARRGREAGAAGGAPVAGRLRDLAGRAGGVAGRLRPAVRPAARAGRDAGLAHRVGPADRALREPVARGDPRHLRRLLRCPSGGPQVRAPRLRRAGRLVAEHEVGESAGGLHAARGRAPAGGRGRASAGAACGRPVARGAGGVSRAARAGADRPAQTRATTAPSTRPSA